MTSGQRAWHRLIWPLLIVAMAAIFAAALIARERASLALALGGG